MEDIKKLSSRDIVKLLISETNVTPEELLKYIIRKK